jgi:hypothetical protein
MKAAIPEKVGKYALVDRPIPTIGGPGQLHHFLGGEQ